MLLYIHILFFFIILRNIGKKITKLHFIYKYNNYTTVYSNNVIHKLLCIFMINNTCFEQVEIILKFEILNEF